MLWPLIHQGLLLELHRLILDEIHIISGRRTNTAHLLQITAGIWGHDASYMLSWDNVKWIVFPCLAYTWISQMIPDVIPSIFLEEKKIHFLFSFDVCSSLGLDRNNQGSVFLHWIWIFPLIKSWLLHQQFPLI